MTDLIFPIFRKSSVVTGKFCYPIIFLQDKYKRTLGSSMYPALVLLPSDLSSLTVPRSLAQYVNHPEGKSGQVTPIINSHSRALLCLQDVHMKRRAFVISQRTSHQPLRSPPRSGNTKTLEFPVHPPCSGFFFLPGFLPSYFSS